MMAGRHAHDRMGLLSALAGFQAGMVGVIAMLALTGLASAWYRRTFWYVANLMSSTFYGDDAIRAGFSWKTVSGIALYLILYSAFGALFGALARDRFPRLRLVLVGILCGVAWYYLWYALLWRWLNPLIPLYTHDRPMLWAHMLYGGMLGRYPLYVRRLLETRREPALLPAPAAPEPERVPEDAPPPLPPNAT
ncbi:MAG TPA: hypothetical protein VN442_19430 [Bryobacteraceae bacterium]|nr:hypothetical protein [Bryobacteraceae bacterium]